MFSYPYNEERGDHQKKVNQAKGPPPRKKPEVLPKNPTKPSSEDVAKQARK